MPNTASAWGPLFAAWMVTLVATLGALFIGEVMGQTPCVLCWYQRVFMFPLAIVLGVGVFREDTRVWLYAGPLALVGFLIAAYHSLLYFGFVAEALKPCGKGPSCSDAAMTILGMPIPLLFTCIVRRGHRAAGTRQQKERFMNKRLSVIVAALAAIVIFAAATYMYTPRKVVEAPAPVEETSLVRKHSPVIGKADAPVTIVEFLDPSCEACRAFYPIVKSVLAEYPDDVRLVVRYAAFHQGSDEAVRIIEASRHQDKFEQVLAALFENQDRWAAHELLQLKQAWEVARTAGIELMQARLDSVKT